MRESGGPDRSSPSWDLILKPPVAQKICAFAFRLQHQAGMVAAAIPATMGDDGYKFLMQKPAHPVQRYMNPDDFSDISLNPVKVAATTKKTPNPHIPNYPSLPSQLLCQVHNINMHADKDTDECMHR
ncbi:hypothetical protein ZWY2020_037299 [Hordeum vulgare]|nr:hypothetical protein ZWY2020_037299 [Hordeum vulgare]